MRLRERASLYRMDRILRLQLAKSASFRSECLLRFRDLLSLSELEWEAVLLSRGLPVVVKYRVRQELTFNVPRYTIIT